MSTLPLTEVEARFSAVLDEITRTPERVIVTRNGRPEVVILSIDDLAAIEETLDVLEPRFARQARRGWCRDRYGRLGRCRGTGAAVAAS